MESVLQLDEDIEEINVESTRRDSISSLPQIQSNTNQSNASLNSEMENNLEPSPVHEVYEKPESKSGSSTMSAPRKKKCANNMQENNNYLSISSVPATLRYFNEIDGCSEEQCLPQSSIPKSSSKSRTPLANILVGTSIHCDTKNDLISSPSTSCAGSNVALYDKSSKDDDFMDA